MTRAIVVDASVAAKWFLSEPDAERAFELLNIATLHAPALLLVEIAAAITRRFRTGGLELDDARRKLALARATLQRPIFELVGDDALIERASEIALNMRHPLQDCLYIACAERFDADLLTVDAALLKRAGTAHPHIKRF